MLRVSGGSQVQVSDLGSTNGTFVDGKELTAMQAVSSRRGGAAVAC
jgi:pSer/pThr/pTyr-binding forkhead associated (FHA) protein